MAPLSSLPPPQRAVLSLIVEKGRTYEEIARLLRLDVDAVRERARLALDALAPPAGGTPPAERRAAIGDYLLGQAPDGTPETLAYLDGSAAARDWARAAGAELAGLAGARLPPIPAEPAPPPPPGASDPPPRPAPVAPPGGTAEHAPAPAVSRRGGAMLLAGGALAVAAVVVAVILLAGGGGPHRRARPPAAAATTTAPAPTAPTASTPAASVAAQITLTAPAGVKVRGLAAVIKRGTQRALAIAAGGLSPTSAHVAYGVWLYNTAADSQLIGFVPPVKADGRISAAAALPTSAGRYRRLVLTREAGTQVTRPGAIVLSGPIPAGATG